MDSELISGLVSWEEVNTGTGKRSMERTPPVFDGFNKEATQRYQN